MDNLWGILDEQMVFKSPKMILNEQIAYLNRMTDGIVEGELIQYKIREVVDKTTGDECGFSFSYAFNLKSKFLKGFKYRILSMGYDVMMYPLYIRVNTDFALALKEDIMKGLSDSEEFDELDYDRQGEIFLANETEYIKLLSIILGSKEVLQIISNIKAFADEQIQSLL